MFAVMIPVDPRAEEIRKAVASRGRFRSAEEVGFLSACRTQRRNAREFVVFTQCNCPEFETTDAHG